MTQNPNQHGSPPPPQPPPGVQPGGRPDPRRLQQPVPDQQNGSQQPQHQWRPQQPLGGSPAPPRRIASPEGERVRESPAGGVSGYFAIVGAVVLLLLALLLAVFGLIMTVAQAVVGIILIVVAVLCFIAAMFMFKGCTSVAPGNAVVLQLYGRYVGTVRQSGLRFVNPLYSKIQVSTRIRNHETSTLKVNDLDGNPIEIGAVVVWQVQDTAQALFEVDDFEEFVAIQAETAVRHIANSYAYDSSDPNRMSLRDNADEITSKLSNEVAARVAAAGVTVIES
ncbi:MAG: SPFH domain-containing protein, partial [Brevibacterium sp.]|nr:SPFH domain-containing protein [Brevibacterium sp.]